MTRKLFPFFFLKILILGCNPSPQVQNNHQTEELLKKPEPSPVVTFESGKIYSSVFTRDGQHNFALYLPKEYQPSKKFPMIIFLDPHGEGSLPLEKYHRLADRFHTILLGSNNSRNGLAFETSEALVNALLAEARTTYSCTSDQISLAGFSGGAKAALASAAAHLDLASVIYCGAAFPPMSVHDLPPALGIAGEKDMNYTEVLKFSESLDASPITHSLLVWPGKHEWPDSIAFLQAFFWTRFHSPTLKPDDTKKWISSFLEIQKQKEKQGDALQKSRILEQNIAFLHGLSTTLPYEEELRKLMNTPEFNRNKKMESEMNSREEAAKQNYLQAFESATTAWWNVEIHKLNADTLDRLHQRLLGFISLAAYSISKRQLQQGDYAATRRTLAIYKMADPENSEHAFIAACMYANMNQLDSAIAALKEAKALGLKDLHKIDSENSFAGIKNTEAFRQLMQNWNH